LQYFTHIQKAVAQSAFYFHINPSACMTVRFMVLMEQHVSRRADFNQLSYFGFIYVLWTFRLWLKSRHLM